MRVPGRLILMKLFVLGAAAISTVPAWANDEIEDIENVPTPTRLAELLPPGGINAVNIRFWLIFSSPDDRGDMRDASYMFWCVEPRAGLLYIEHIYGSDRGGRHGAGYHYRKRFKYTPDGRFKSYYADLQLGGGDRRVITSEIHDNQLLLTTIHTKRWLVLKPRTTERTIPLTRFDQAVPVEWMPLIIAYHIRKGSLGYEIATMELATGESGYTYVEDMGTEQYPLNGKQHTAHFLSIGIDVERGDENRKETIKLLAAKDGNYFQFFYPGSDTSVRRSSIEEVCKVFGIKKNMPVLSNRDVFTTAALRPASPK